MNPYSKKGSLSEPITIDEDESATIGKLITEGNGMNQGENRKTIVNLPAKSDCSSINLDEEVAHALGDELDEEEVVNTIERYKKDM